jgi:hypothetical protein
MGRKRLPRLSIQECKDLLAAHDHIRWADQALHNSSWGSASAVRALIGYADRVISDLYNKAEPVFLELMNQMPAATPGDGSLAESEPTAAAAAPATEGMQKT